MSGLTVLIGEDDTRHLDILKTLLEDWGYKTICASEGATACRLANLADLALLDVRMPEMDGLAAFAKIHTQHPLLPVIIMTAYSEIEDAVKAIREGAWDYLTKPLDFDKLRICLRNASEKLELASANAQLEADLSRTRSPLLGASEPMRTLAEMIRMIGPTEATVLIEGESGTGKELAARAVYEASPRSTGPFVAVNCGALTETLLASELFGHEKGAFTGADKKREGLFRQARGGVIFLDEIGEMPLAMQVKLLRALQEREYMPVGGNRSESMDCRIIAATNRDLASEIRKGSFREDLYYRLNVMSLKMPALRERKDDIPLLASHFARKFARENNRIFKSIEPEALDYLCVWHWPGNVRELMNVMERAIILMPGEVIEARCLPEQIRKTQQQIASVQRLQESGTQPGQPTLEEIEKRVILRTLKRMGNNKTETARALGITRKTLHAKLRSYEADTL